MQVPPAVLSLYYPGVTEPPQKTLNEEIDDLIHNFRSNSLSTQEASSLFDSILDKLDALTYQDSLLTERELYRLLGLPSEKFQKLVFPKLESIFRHNISKLWAEQNKNRFKDFLKWEEQVSLLIQNCIQSESPCELLLLFLNLHQISLEYLWLFSLLVKAPEPSEDVREYVEEIKLRAVQWIDSLEESKNKDEEVEEAIEAIKKRIGLLEKELPEEALMQIREFNHADSFFWSEIADFYFNAGYYDFACSWFLNNVQLIDFIENKGQATEHLLIKKACICYQIAFCYRFKGMQREEIAYLKKAFVLTKTMPGRAGIFYSQLGIAYAKLDENKEALDYFEKALVNTPFLNDASERGKLYFNMGPVYDSLGQLEKAIECYENARKLGLNSDEEKARYYIALGAAYQSKSNYKQAFECQKEALKIAERIEDQDERNSLIMKSYLNQAMVYKSVGESGRALKLLEESFSLAKKLQDTVSLAKIYSAKGMAFDYLGRHKDAIACLQKSLEIGKRLSHTIQQGKAYDVIGVAQISLEQYEEAIINLKKALKIAQSTGNREGEGTTHSHLGLAYDAKGESKKALKHHNLSLSIAKELNSLEGQGKCYHNLGFTYRETNLKEAENNLRQSIECYSLIQKKLIDHNQWKITLFEEQANAFVELEKILSKQTDREHDTLELTDFRRSRALIAHLKNKLPSNLQEAVFDHPLTIDRMKELAASQETTFIVYSLAFLEEKQSITAWVISSQTYEIIDLPIESIQQDIQNIQKIFEQFPFTRPKGGQKPLLLQAIKQILYSLKKDPKVNLRGSLFDIEDETEQSQIWQDNVEEESQFSSAFDLPSENSRPSSGDTLSEHLENVSLFDIDDEVAIEALVMVQRREVKKMLKNWYQALITPLQNYLPKSTNENSVKTITIIPEGFLSQLPFASFCDEKDIYLIEKYALSLVPSIQTLDLLSKLPKQKNEKHLFVGNPNTGNPKDNLLFAEQEIAELQKIFKANSEEILLKEKATVTQVKERMKDARWIFLTCHGDANIKPINEPYSVFEGHLRLAPDTQYEEGYLHAEEISKLTLQAELVVLSACYSGTGKIQQEGSIGPVWSFLAVGAQSVLATYWPLQDSPSTIEMVKNFSKYILGEGTEKLKKAQALQKVMKEAIIKDRDKPDQWGAFYLAGLSE